MPKETFIRLKDEKRKSLTDAFLREFATHKYDDASLSNVVKSLGIAKGSIYQYFNDKFDLFMYLSEICVGVKIKYVDSIKREDFPDYWSYFKTLYECGCKFDNENPLESHFLHNLPENMNSPSVKNLLNDMEKKTVMAFEKMVEYEINLGLFREDVPIKTMAFMLYKVGVTIRDQLQFDGIINPNESIMVNKPVYQGKKEQLIDVVENYIKFIRVSFDKKKQL